MTLTQMHERLRQELIRRIQRGTLNVSLLSRQTGLAQAHVSNFLRKKRALSNQAIDRVLLAQHIQAEDLLLSRSRCSDSSLDPETSFVPIVSHDSALFEPMIYASAVLAKMPVPADILRSLRARAPSKRLPWQRFVAVLASYADARAMEPILSPDAHVVIDRHYNALAPYRPPRPSIYAVRCGAHLALRYIDYAASRLVLRPQNIDVPIQLLEIEPGERPQDLIAGRVVLVLNQT